MVRPAEGGKPTARKSLRTPARSPEKKKQSKRKRSTPTKKRKYHALNEIRHYQRMTRLLIQKLPFARVVREILMDVSGQNLRIQSLALEALQESAETFLVCIFEASNLCCIHAKRVTLMNRDMRLVQAIWKQ